MEKGTWCTMLILNTWTCVWICVFKDPSLITSKWFKVNSSSSPLCNQHTLTGWLPVIVARSVMSVPSSTWQSCRGSMKAGGSKLLLEESGENPERENRDETRDEQMRYYVYNDLCDSANNFIVANIFSRHVLINTCYYRHQILWITDRRGAADNLSFTKAILAFFLTHPETMSHDSRSLLRSYMKPWTFTKFRAVLSCKEWIWGRTLKATWELHFWLTKKVLKKVLCSCQSSTIPFTTYQCQKVSWKSRCLQVLVHSLLVLMHWVAWAVS